eukprot:3326887-Amphidinium_carterae.1
MESSRCGCGPICSIPELSHLRAAKYSAASMTAFFLQELLAMRHEWLSMPQPHLKTHTTRAS